MPAYPRSEMEEMVERWLQANRRAENGSNWRAVLGNLYTEDAEYRANMGPNKEFFVKGRSLIIDVALGEEMEGFDGWTYPYDDVLIDDAKGEVVAFWRQVSPYTRADGTPYQVEGLSGSRFVYGGNYQWTAQTDWVDLGNTIALITELAADGHTNPVLAKRIVRMARGGLATGHRHIRPDAGMLRQGLGVLNLAKTALLGR